MSSERAPARRSDDEGRRAELIAAASRVVARDGIAAATTRRIAEEAGVPSGLVHYWFSGKDELLEAVVGDVLGDIEGAVAQAAPGEDVGATLEQRLHAAFRAVEEDDRGRQVAMYELTTWALRREEMPEVARHQYEAYRQLAAAGMQGAELPDDPALAGLVAALFDGLTLSWLADPEGTDPYAVLSLLARLLESQADR